MFVLVIYSITVFYSQKKVCLNEVLRKRFLGKTFYSLFLALISFQKVQKDTLILTKSVMLSYVLLTSPTSYFPDGIS